MITVNLHEAKTHFSALVEKASHGETVVVCKRNVPVVTLSALHATPAKKRAKGERYIGKAKYKFKVPDSFFDPLPADMMKAFSGED